MISTINKLSYYESNTYIPYHNQAIEEYLLNCVDEDEVILYLWQNQNTVVIGKNQNAYNECNIKELEKDNAYLARRISGGGAVYHDLDNLNFTFLSNVKNYDVSKQCDVIIKAINQFGIEVKKDVRNDLLANGKKFSGHAYYRKAERCLHHGTIMVDVNEDRLNNYLKVSKLKLQAKSIDSVRSRIINLKDINVEIDIKKLKKELIKSFEEIYGHKAELLNNLDEKIIQKYEDRFSSSLWRYGEIKSYSYKKEKKYSWGILRIEYNLDDDLLSDIAIYTDSLNVDIFNTLNRKLVGLKLGEIKELSFNNQEEIDVIELLLEEQRYV